jgi:hypothetical protein
MDEQQFDDLTRRLATATSRRQMLRGLAAGATATILIRFRPDKTAAKAADDCKRDGKACKKDQQCCGDAICSNVVNGRGVCCTPATCQPGQCGTIDDGCGGTIDCDEFPDYPCNWDEVCYQGFCEVPCGDDGLCPDACYYACPCGSSTGCSNPNFFCCPSGNINECSPDPCPSTTSRFVGKR